MTDQPGSEDQTVPPGPPPEDAERDRGEQTAPEMPIQGESPDWVSDVRSSLKEAPPAEEKPLSFFRRLQLRLFPPSKGKPAPVTPETPAREAPPEPEAPVAAGFYAGESAEVRAEDASPIEEVGGDLEEMPEETVFEEPSEETISEEKTLSGEDSVKLLRDDLRLDQEEESRSAGMSGFLAALLGKRGEDEEETLGDEDLERRLPAVQIEPEPAGLEPGEEIPPVEAQVDEAHAGTETPFDFEQDLQPEAPEMEEIAAPASAFELDEEAPGEVEELGLAEEALSQTTAAEAEKAPAAEQAPEAPLEPYEDLRTVALQDYVEPLPEAQPRSLTALAGEWWYELSLLQRMILVGLLLFNLALVTIGVFMFGSAALSSLLPRRAVQAVPTATSDVPFPIEITLPGGWPLSLKTATIQDGKWVPTGPEWLQGTVIRRWIAIPSSKELEAVFRTIQPGDKITLKMNNLDEWVYTVESAQQVSAELLPTYNQNRPSVLIFLTDGNTDKRWVVIADR